nr:MAG TPA: hypothetical protein [Caudoviricetes sp.]
MPIEAGREEYNTKGCEYSLNSIYSVLSPC